MHDASTVADLLARFRALGGIADNLGIRPCAHGLGVFAVHPRRPVRLVTPSRLLIAPSALAVTPQGHVQVGSVEGMAPDVVAFHELYQRRFGWGAGGWESISQHWQQLCALPDALKQYLQILGCQDDLSRPLTPGEAFQLHCRSRQILVNGLSRLMPMLELVNHADEGVPYEVSSAGVGLSGTFRGEVMARYRRHMDAFHFFYNYHFATPGRIILSCDVRIDAPGARSLRITRMDARAQVRDGVRHPQVNAGPDEIHLSFVELFNRDQPASPRQVLVGLLQEQGMPARSAHQLFDGLLAHNCQVRRDFLQACDGLDGRVVQGLRDVAAHQLEGLMSAS